MIASIPYHSTAHPIDFISSIGRIYKSIGCRVGGMIRAGMDLAVEAERLRSAAEARPLKLPVNRRIVERHGSIAGALPEAVVLPADRDQVVRVVRLAAHHAIPVVPRGAGTGLSGGAVTLKGGIAL